MIHRNIWRNEENWLANYKALKSHILEYCYFHNKHDKRFIKSNLGKKGAMKKLSSLLHSHDFVNLEEVDKMIEWEKVGKVEM